MNHYRVCAWCQTVISDDNVTVALNTTERMQATHGICDLCLTRLIEEEMTLEMILEKIPYPILVVSDDVSVLASNSKGSALLGKSSGEIKGKLAGNVISCTYAKLPGGCGHTPSCDSCKLRNTVRNCFETGCVQLSVKEDKYLEINGSPDRYNLQFTVEMLENAALVHIEEFDRLKKRKSIAAGK